MKSVNFFIEKANLYIAEIDSILETYVGILESETKTIPEGQNQRINDLRLKTKLLFSEFDHGQLFLEALHQRYSFDNLDGVLIHYQSILKLFIDHLRYYRE